MTNLILSEILSINQENEFWRDIINYEGLYEISNFGSVRSLERSCLARNNSYRRVVAKTLKLFIIKGYYYVNLNNNGIRQFRVNVLVGKHFIDNPEQLPELNHEDGNKLNNHYTNLKWCDRSYNQQHAIRTGLKIVGRGNTSPNHTLTQIQVEDIRLRLSNGVTGRLLAFEYNVTEAMISLIKHNKNWKT